MREVVVQGLGVVGSAMATALAAARKADGSPHWRVTGLDLPTEQGLARIGAMDGGHLPFDSADPTLVAAAAAAHAAGNVQATADPAVMAEADVVVVDVHLDVAVNDAGDPSVDFEPLEVAVGTIGAHVRPGALVMVETTVPPGTCERIVAPALDRALSARGLDPASVRLAHSYERVMPGERFLESITHMWRVYAGRTPEAAQACGEFLGSFIDLERHPATELATMTASETAKVVENAYRATNIAFIEEWGRLAEVAGVDLFTVIDAIRVRPTHANLRQPGLGVGGYCLTKDPYMGTVAARQLFGRPELSFPFSEAALRHNADAPRAAADRLDTLLGGLADRRVLLLGAAYRPGVADTRQSPSEIFLRVLRRGGAEVRWHDPWVHRWEELGETRDGDELPAAEGFDAVVLAVAHDAYVSLDWAAWLGDARPLVFDANRVLSDSALDALRTTGTRIASIGRGRRADDAA